MPFLPKKMTAFSVLANLIAGSLLLTGCGPGARKGYRIEDGDVVFYAGFPAIRSVVAQADDASFTAINDDFGKDKNYAFYLGKIIPNADPATFTYLGGSYAKDKRNGYSRDLLISTDGPHFDVIPNPEETVANVSAQGIAYARDSRRVYRDVVVIDGADPATFVFVPMFNGNYLTRDHRRVYFQDKPIAGVDGASFRKVSTLHFRDKQSAWGLVLGREIYWSPITQADLPTFTTGAGDKYVKDKYRVYFGPDTLKGADPLTFKAHHAAANQ